MVNVGTIISIILAIIIYGFVGIKFFKWVKKTTQYNDNKKVLILTTIPAMSALLIALLFCGLLYLIFEVLFPSLVDKLGDAIAGAGVVAVLSIFISSFNLVFTYTKKRLDTTKSL